MREIIAPSAEELFREFESLNVDKGGIGIMLPKSRFHVLRLRAIKSPAANILKQEMLSVGGECATSQTVILGDAKPQDVMIMGTRRQLAKLGKKLKAQPFGLKGVAGQIGAFLERTSRAAGRLDPALAPLADGLDQLPLIMGIVNVTPDSFSDGGEFLEESAAVVRGLQQVEEGAEIVDIGGESTRPGADPVPEGQELDRVLPAITALRKGTDRAISIDTTKSGVASAALRDGATMVNDISAGRVDPGIMGVVADAGCPFVLMHMLGEPRTMQEQPHYDLLMDELHRFFDERIAQALEAGVKEEQIILDPGIGFGKRMEDNFAILRRLPELSVFGRPIMVGASRKSFLQSELGKTPQNRLEQTLAAGTVAMLHGAHIVRVHDVAPAVKTRLVVRELMGSA
ncbi:MAG: dihydropteroate synthase [Candidatus Neomarinimicrobiota bacterium]